MFGANETYLQCQKYWGEREGCGKFSELFASIKWQKMPSYRPGQHKQPGEGGLPPLQS